MVARRGPERALGAALASDPKGAGELATRVDGFLLGVDVERALVSPEKVPLNRAATLLRRAASEARGKKGGPKGAGPGREKRGRRRDGLKGEAGVVRCVWLLGGKARRRRAVVRGGSWSRFR